MMLEKTSKKVTSSLQPNTIMSTRVLPPVLHKDGDLTTSEAVYSNI